MTRFGWPVDDLPYLPLTIAHRGASDYRTENSLQAFSLASELFAEMWEIDVRLSADGVVVVAHDDNLARVTGRGLRVSEATWSEICSIRLPDGQFVPRLGRRGPGRRTGRRSLYRGQVRRFRRCRLAGDRGQGIHLRRHWVLQCRVDCRSETQRMPLSAFRHCPELRRPVFLQRRSPTRHPAPVLARRVLRAAQVDCRGPDLAMRAGWRRDRSVARRSARSPRRPGRAAGLGDLLPSARNTEALSTRGQQDIRNRLPPRRELSGARKHARSGSALHRSAISVRRDGCSHDSRWELAVIHDATLDRTTNRIGPVSSRTQAEIRKLDAGGWKAPGYTGLRVPTLNEMLEMSRDRIGVYVEIKDAEPEAVLGEVVKRGMIELVFFWCWDMQVLDDIRSQMPDTRLMAPRREHSSLEAAISDYSANIVQFELGRDNLSEITACQELGVQSMVFCLTSNLSGPAKVLAVSPDLVNLDRLDLFRILQAYPDLVGNSRELVPPRVA